MKFEQLLLSALSRADEEPGDEIIDMVAEDSINLGYHQVATSVDLQVKRIKMTYDDIDGYELPDDCHSILAIEYGDVRLSMNDFYTEANKLYITNKDYKNKKKELLIRYVFYPPKMVKPTDEPVTNKNFDTLITLYGAYHILIYKKRYSMAEMVKAEYNQIAGVEQDEL